MTSTNCPTVSTYVHVSRDARVSHSVDASSLGVSTTLRIGDHGQNDAVLFFRTPEQLETLASEALRAASELRKIVAFRAATDGVANGK